MDVLESIRSFTAVVDAGGFAAAARDKGVTRSVINKHVKKLEEMLGAQLLQRSTRVVTPTETGLAFYARCNSIVADLDAAIAAVSEMQESPGGTLRINAPMSFGTLHLAPWVSDFMLTHPQLHVELSLSDRFVDPLEEGFDISLRISEPRSYTSLVTRELGAIHLVLCASEGYLSTHGEPDSAASLKQHRCLHYGYQESGTQWRLSGPEGDISVPVNCAMWSNNGEVLAAASSAHQGIALLPEFIVADALQQGRLRRIMPDYAPQSLTLCALYPRHRHLSSRLRLFADFLEQKVAAQTDWTRGP